MNNKLYSMSKTGKLLVWDASLNNTPNDDGFLEITITSGQDTGKKVSKVRHVKKGMNIGKSNETTLHEQAELELERLYTKQIDKGYINDPSKVTICKQVGEVKKPMLADKYPDKAHRLPSPDKIITQPKIDGVRCFITKLDDNSIQFTSRSGKPIPNVSVIENAIKDILPVGDIIDGELYIEGYELQDIISVVLPTKNIKHEELKNVKLYWYDYIPHGKDHESYYERFMNNTISFNNDVIDRLDGHEFSEDTLEKRFDDYIEAGYEGLMLRDITTPYYFGRRSTSLQKYKKMHTDEFQIVDIIESPQDDTPRIVCDLRNGNVVTVRMTGDKEQNLEYLNNKEQYIGKWLTIKYQTWTKTGSLQFPVGVSIRDGEVINSQFIPSI